ncbi:MAG: Smr/MutS family protein [Flavobacteriaceae bacterium]|nr:Smr/MutS family protein [Flavobacteriaceae bacterium]
MANDKDFHIGDKIGLINDTLSGIIIKMDKHHITLECDEGFTYNCKPNEIIQLKNFDEALSNKNIHNSITEKGNVIPKNNKSRDLKKSSVLEIDLHMHQLIDSEKGMTNFEMLSIQLAAAKKKLEFAITKKAQRVVFIHGIGEGVLKNELHLMLKKYPVEIFEASYTNYGQGATEVYIYQNG